MAEEKGSEGTTGACRNQILGICVVYCDGSERKEVWLNLNRVQALAWCDGRVGTRPGNPTPQPEKLPRGPAPGSCPEGVQPMVVVPLCWWTGSQWVCGDE
jgi:hypothetical protein